ncbi:MAG TPA: MYG1 family protein [Candidatus Paceibacterota bacterium]|nr:MYG1 family protein [Candidatus Paceibacterota bacterium]
MKTVVTHNGSFHADDVFAIATLKIVLGDFKLIRSRDEEVMKPADIVVDTGRIYDPLQLRFDHHQEGGAGARDNGIQYAAFGLVWKEFGEKVCGSKEIAERVDRAFVAVIDAHDNGMDLSKALREDITDFNVSGLISSFNPTFLEEENHDEIFLEMVDLAIRILKRQIAIALSIVEGGKIFMASYEAAEDKRLVVLDRHLNKNSWQEFVEKLPEVLFVVLPYGSTWALRAVRKDLASFDNRKNLPNEWAGKAGEELEKITGVSGAMFCHNKLFVANAKTKEAALALAKLALDN